MHVPTGNIQTKTLNLAGFLRVLDQNFFTNLVIRFDKGTAGRKRGHHPQIPLKDTLDGR
jgi:hypothetical protein